MPHAIAGKQADSLKGQHILLRDDGRGLWIPRGILGGKGERFATERNRRKETCQKDRRWLDDSELEVRAG